VYDTPPHCDLAVYHSHQNFKLIISATRGVWWCCNFVVYDTPPSCNAAEVTFIWITSWNWCQKMKLT